MIEKDHFVLERVFHAMNNRPDYQGPDAKLYTKLHRFAQRSAPKILPVLYAFARRFPPEAVEAKITPEWLLKRAEKYPEIKAELERHGEKGRKWLEIQALELRLFFTGRLVWDPRQKKLVIIGERRRA